VKTDPTKVARIQDLMTGAYFGGSVDHAFILSFQMELRSFLDDGGHESRKFLEEAFGEYSFEERKRKTETLLRIMEESVTPTFDPRWNVFQDALDSLTRIHALISHHQHQQRAA